jgi:hypothetical protein
MSQRQRAAISPAIRAAEAWPARRMKATSGRQHSTNGWRRVEREGEGNDQYVIQAAAEVTNAATPRRRLVHTAVPGNEQLRSPFEAQLTCRCRIPSTHESESRKSSFPVIITRGRIV